MKNTAQRLTDLRDSLNVSQLKLSKLLGISQSAINRYERDLASVPDTVLLKYADFFNISADYLLGRCDDPKGKRYDFQPEYLKNKLTNSAEWREFVDMCFDPASPIYSKLKELVMQMADSK